jgi:hypothetical protein
MTDSVHASANTRRRAIVVGGVVPVLIAAIGTVLMWSWIPELPDPVAIHWSGSEPDGFGSAWSLALTPLGIALAYAAIAIAGTWSLTPRGRLAANQKFLLVTGIWLSAFLTVGIAQSLSIQRGLADASEVGSGDSVGLGLLLGGILGVTLAVPAWFVLPPADAEYAEAPDAEPLAVAETERISWSRTVRLGGVASAVLGGAILLMITTIVITAVATSRIQWSVIAVLALVLLLALATAAWRVSADRRGLVVRSALGWPRIVIQAADIRQVSVVTINPPADFGGWGWRMDVAGRRGIIMRAGPAIQVTRASGQRFVVTVDDAETGASVLAAVVAARTR